MPQHSRFEWTWCWYTAAGRPSIQSLFALQARNRFATDLEQLLDRKLTCGISSFMLQLHEAERLLSGHSNPHE